MERKENLGEITERRWTTNSVSTAFAGQGESNSHFHSPLTNHRLKILKRKEKKKFSLRDTDLARPATASLRKPALHFSSQQAPPPPALTIHHPSIGSCISRSRRPWGRAACPCGLWPISVSAPPCGLATPSARPGRGHSDILLLRGRPCSSGTCQHKQHCQQESPTGTGGLSSPSVRLHWGPPKLAADSPC